MGGEPTFVSIDDMDGAEWNTTADWGRKSGGWPATCSGGWPTASATGRCSTSARASGIPASQLPALGTGLLLAQGRRTDLARSRADRRRRRRLPSATTNPAQRFIQHLAERLDVDAEDIVPGYEDVWYYMWKERRLPVNVDPLKSNLGDEDERKRLARIFERGLSEIVGYALPVRPVYSEPTTTRWESGRWFLRQENMFLLPGDSPMGSACRWTSSLGCRRRHHSLARTRSAGAARPAVERTQPTARAAAEAGSGPRAAIRAGFSLRQAVRCTSAA